MAQDHGRKVGPLVSVLIPTYNRRRYLPVALSSVVNQSYGSLEIFVIRDGGQDVSDIVNSFNDQRITFINRGENRGKAFSLNEAMNRAGGKYIAYLDDDDLFYPNHIETLVNALENQTDCQVAYSDLYKVHCRIGPDGSREVLDKMVDISRDFDRFVMLYYNHVLHVSIMHRRDLIEKIGPYNENLNVLIDWDLTRRLVFFTDFYHVHEITGEFYCPVGGSDRISIQQRKDKGQYLKNAMTIRTTRPPKPWPKINDVSIIFVTDCLDKQAVKTLTSIWQSTFYPCRFHLPLSQSDFDRLNTDMPNIVRVPVEPGTSESQRIDAALAGCEGELVALVPKDLSIGQMWLEDPLYGLINSTHSREAIKLEGSTDKSWAMVIRKDELQHVRDNFPDLSIHESLKADGVVIRPLCPEEIPFQFDQLLCQAAAEEKQNNWSEAARILEYMAEHYQNELWMRSRTARALFEAGRFKEAAELSSRVNQQRPTVETLLLEAKIRHKEKEFTRAIELLEKAEQILEGNELVWT